MKQGIRNKGTDSHSHEYSHYSSVDRLAGAWYNDNTGYGTQADDKCRQRTPAVSWNK